MAFSPTSPANKLKRDRRIIGTVSDEPVNCVLCDSLHQWPYEHI
jgi:hypothetical protein